MTSLDLPRDIADSEAYEHAVARLREARVLLPVWDGLIEEFNHRTGVNQPA